MQIINIDIETYSSEDLTKCGVYRYAEADDFAILLLAYAIDGGPVLCVDLASGEEIPAEVVGALTDPTVTKTAFNAAFERVCLSRWLGLDKPMDPDGWYCTMVGAARMGLPLSLGQCAEALGLEQGKMKEGKALINYFSKPDRNGRRRMPTDAPEKWAVFRSYNIRDVEVEKAIYKKVSGMPVPRWEGELLWRVDQRINDRGVMVDLTMVSNAARMDEEYRVRLMERAKAITGLENPNSTQQIKDHIREVTGFRVETLSKGSLEDLEKNLGYWPKLQQLIGIRRELGKTSNKKYAAMLSCVCKDHRIHGLLQFYGAARTGRWAGRLVQVQNLPQNHLDDIDAARQMVVGGDLDEMLLAYDNPMQVLSELIRTAFVASPGHTFHVCDFSAIEARVIAWLAGEQWVLDVFRQGGDIYCATASKMFGVPVEKHGRNAHLRQRGKVAVLALGYGGGVSALEAMGGSRLGLTEEEMRNTVRQWRGANPRIVRLWERVQNAAAGAILNENRQPINRGIVMECHGGMLTVKLPSGRYLCYPEASLEEENGKTDICYMGVNQTTRKWEKVRTYGGKMTENLVQAIARDILGWIILRADRAGMPIVFHIHDEIVVDAPPSITLQEVEAIFSKPISWCPDLPLKGAGYSTPYYLKD